MAKSRLKLVSPATVKRTVAPPRRRPNAELRPREHLTEREVEKLIEAAKGNRHGGRDSAMILICFRHGLRASEALTSLETGNGRSETRLIASSSSLLLTV